VTGSEVIKMKEMFQNASAGICAVCVFYFVIMHELDMVVSMLKDTH